MLFVITLFLITLASAGTIFIGGLVAGFFLSWIVETVRGWFQ